MRSWFCKVFLFCLLIPFIGIAQKDSVYTDTVLIVKPPLVIEKKVHVSLGTKEPMHLDKSFELGAFYSVATNIAPSPSFQTSAFHSSGLKASILVNNWAFGLGAGLLSSSIKYQPIDSFTIEIIETRKCFPQRDSLGNVIKLTCIPLDTGYNAIKVNANDYKTSITLLQIPFSVGYTFAFKKWKMIPALQLVFLYNIGSRSDFWQWRQSLWMAGAEINLRRQLSDHLSTELKLEYKTTLQSFSENNEFKRHLHLLGLGIGVTYSF